MQIKNIDARMTFTGECELIITLPKGEKQAIDGLLQSYDNTKPYEVEVKPKRNKKSNTANGKAWLLLGRIAEELSKENPISAEDVYKEMVPFCSSGTILIMKDEAVEKHIHIWEKEPSTKIGWTCKILGHKNGYTEVLNYYGSSCFDTVEMHKLLTLIVQECKPLGIETLSPNEIERLVQLHGK